MNNFLATWHKNEQYFEALRILASLSGLFSDSTTPYLDYRLAENVFCKFFNAENEARSCTAYDARISDMGIGIKTFTLKNNQSIEKIAEFNRLKSELDPLDGLDLARKLGEFRNARIQIADDMYKTSARLYHIVGRTENCLRIFNTEYDTVNTDNICVTKNNYRSFSFSDGCNEYFFNRSKSVLIKRFQVPRHNVKDVPVSILEDPLTILFDFFRQRQDTFAVCRTNYIPGRDYVILPLYSTRGNRHEVPKKSGLNQWNAAGRPRNPDEVYIPIPAKVRGLYPDFFPSRDEHFSLSLPDGNILSAKVCQDGSKALMSTHNADLGKWILRKILHKPEGELVTMNDLNIYGIDSVRIVNEHTVDENGLRLYSISFTTTDYESYSDFSELGDDELY